MGLYFFKNATAGGDWIIQERLDNDAFVSSLLPDNAPLSTMRVISASRLHRFLKCPRALGPRKLGSSIAAGSTIPMYDKLGCQIRTWKSRDKRCCLAIGVLCITPGLAVGLCLDPSKLSLASWRPSS